MTDVYWIGPESGTYHTLADCPTFTHARRYWPVHKGPKPPLSDHFSSRGSERRLCKVCLRRSVDRMLKDGSDQPSPGAAGSEEEVT